MVCRRFESLAMRPTATPSQSQSPSVAPRTTQESSGRVVWVTGLSGAGKSTLSEATSALLRAQGKHVVRLDGDDLREVFGAAAASLENHGREARLALALQYA